MESIEQRRAPRAHFSSQVLVHTGNRKIVGKALDLSVDGISFTVPDDAVSRAQMMRIFFTLGQDWVAVDAILARELEAPTGRAWAVRFVDLPEGTAAEIAWIVGRPAPPPRPEQPSASP